MWRLGTPGLRAHTPVHGFEPEIECWGLLVFLQFGVAPPSLQNRTLRRLLGGPFYL